MAIIQHRRGTTADWERCKDLVLARGEIGVQYCTDKSVIIKVGDGETTYENLKDLTIPGYAKQASIDLLNKRVDTIIGLPEGSTIGDAQLADLQLRVDVVEDDLEYLKENLNEFVDVDVVDGLKYEDNILYLTSKGEIVSEGVEIVSGGGPSSSTIIKLLNNNESNTFSVADNQPAIIKFTFTSTEDGVDTGDANCTVSVGGSLKSSFRIKQGPNKIDVSEYLKSGINSVQITCTDIYGNSKSLTYSITLIELKIVSTFHNDIKEPLQGDILYKYTPYGLIDKVVHFVVDGTEVGTELIKSSGKPEDYTISALTHGAHTLDVYMTAELDGMEVSSDHLKYEFIFIEEGETDPIIVSPYEITAVKQGELIDIPFMVYDPTKLYADVTLTISHMVNGKEEIYSQKEQTVDRTEQHFSTRKYPLGKVSFTISYDDIIRTHIIEVEKSDIDVEAVTTGLQLYLTSDGRSNNEKIPFQWNYKDITTSFDGFNWKTNGWVTDDEGDTCLRLFGDSNIEINYQPFNEDLRQTGKTIEFEYVVHDVNNRDAILIDCMSNGIGFRATADRAKLVSEQSEVECFYKEDEKIRVAFTIENRNEYRLLSVYLNGILSGVQQYPTTDNFQQSIPVTIKIGSPYSAIDLYNIRIYSTALSMLDITNNYIADMTNIVTKQELYEANNIYNMYGQLDYELIKTRVPTITFVGQMPTYKGDKKKNSVRMIFEHPQYPELNFDEILKEIDVQGTSSQFYARKNWKIKHNSEHQHVPGAIPAKVFCIKVDYAEATGTYNTQNANLAHYLYTEPIPPQEIDERVRTTILGYPIVIFEKATEDSEPVFSSKGNFNYDKGSEDAFGFNDDWTVECWEFCNNTSNACNFLGPVPANWKDDFEPRYLAEFETEDGLKISFDRIEDLQDKETLTPEEEAELVIQRREAIKRFKEMHDWVISTKGDVQKFKREFSNWFDLHYTAVYYVYTFVMLMVDQRAKNLFLTYWDKTGKWYPYLYDNDTCVGINNEGEMVFDYYHEDTDLLDNANVYNGQDSTLWVNFREAFSSEIKQVYTDLRNNGKLTYETLVDYFITNGSKQWSASVYNEDAEYKYLEMLRAKDDASNLYQVRGSGEEHFKYFVENRLKYCDSKWYGPNYANNYVSLRIYTPKGEQVIEPNADITVTPYSDMYVGVKYKANGTLQQQRASKNESVTIVAPDETFNDTETAIYGASEISSLGDLAPLYCGTVNLSAATKLIDIKVGDATPGYVNNNLHELSIGTNKLLKKIDVRNCPKLTSPLALTNCPNIEEIYAEGSGITGVELAESGYIRVMHLPGTVTNLTIKNQLYIEDLQIENYDTLKTLCVDNCPTVDGVDLLSKCKNLERVRLTNIHWDIPDIEFLRSLYHLGGINENGTNTDDAYLIGTCHIDELTGEEMVEILSHYPYLTISYDKLTLNVTYKSEDGSEELYKVTSTFINGSTEQGATAIDPVAEGIIETPTKESTAKYHFSFGGWSRKPNSKPNNEALEGIISDTTIYVAFDEHIRSYKVRFFNGYSIEKEVMVEYGSTAYFGDEIPIKKDTTVPEVYEFVGWLPSPENIIGPTDCYAQFYFNEEDEDLYKFVLSDFEYTPMTSAKKLALTKYIGVATAGKILDTYLIGDEYRVTTIQGFKGTDIELVVLPDTLETINTDCFSECRKLVLVIIPKNVSYISNTAFKLTPALEEISVEEGNQYFTSKDNCVIDTRANKLIIGCKNSIIPNDGSVTDIGSYSFWGCKKTSIVIPDCITRISAYSFTDSSITNFDLPANCKYYGAMAFYGTPISKLVFSENTEYIGMYCTNTCKKLTSITIKQTDPTKITIDEKAFEGTTNLTTINVPWLEGEVPNAPWGATNAAINYNYAEV